MSRKTRIALPPGTELDPDNPDHIPHILDECYEDMERHPKPKMAPPERSRWWWFWRAFGFFLYQPLRKYLMRYLERDWVGAVYGEHERPGYWVYRWPLAGPLKTWIERGRRGRLRNLLDWLTDINVYSQCSSCGFTEYDDEFTIYDGPDDTEGRTINMFEWLEGGDVDYWGEGQDAHGWQWCYRCGAVDWETT